MSSGEIDAVNTPTNAYYNACYNSEFHDMLGIRQYGWTFPTSSTTPTVSNLSPRVRNSTKISLLSSGLTSSTWCQVAYSNPCMLDVNATTYSMSCEVYIHSDTTLGFSDITATLGYTDMAGNRTSRADAAVDITKLGQWQTVTVTGIAPDSSAKGVRVEFWVKTSSSGKGGHVEWTQPYLTPFSTVGALS